MKRIYIVVYVSNAMHEWEHGTDSCGNKAMNRGTHIAFQFDRMTHKMHFLPCFAWYLVKSIFFWSMKFCENDNSHFTRNNLATSTYNITHAHMRLYWVIIIATVVITVNKSIEFVIWTNTIHKNYLEKIQLIRFNSDIPQSSLLIYSFITTIFILLNGFVVCIWNSKLWQNGRHTTIQYKLLCLVYISCHCNEHADPYAIKSTHTHTRSRPYNRTCTSRTHTCISWWTRKTDRVWWTSSNYWWIKV